MTSFAPVPKQTDQFRARKAARYRPVTSKHPTGTSHCLPCKHDQWVLAQAGMQATGANYARAHRALGRINAIFHNKAIAIRDPVALRLFTEGRSRLTLEQWEGMRLGATLLPDGSLQWSRSSEEPVRGRL
jgi:hypothetical protein